MKYLRISKNRILINFQYRFNSLVTLLAYIFSFVAIYFVWVNIYSSKDMVGTYTKFDMMVYIFIVNMLHYLYNFTNLTRLGGMVHSGSLTNILIRPMNIKLEAFFYYLGENFFKFCMLLVGILAFGVVIKNNFIILTIILFLLSIIMYFNLEQCLSCLGFWMLETWPLIGLINGIYYILSGSTFPLDILPEKIYNIIKFNPFSIVAYALTKSIQNDLSLQEYKEYIIATIIWIIIFEIGYKWILKMGLKKYEGMGA